MVVALSWLVGWHAVGGDPDRDGPAIEKINHQSIFLPKTFFFLAVLWNRSGRQTERSGPVGKRSGRQTERSGPVGNSVGPPDRALWLLGRWCRGSTERSRRASPHREERLLEHGSCAARDALTHVHALPRTRATARAPTARPSLSLAASTAPLALCGLCTPARLVDFRPLHLRAPAPAPLADHRACLAPSARQPSARAHHLLDLVCADNNACS